VRAALVVMVLLAGCSPPPASPSPSPAPPLVPEARPTIAAQGRWQAYPGVFAGPAGSTADVAGLILDDSCFHAVGTVTGSAGVSGVASWTAGGDCTAPAPLRPQEAPGPDDSGFTDDQTIIGVVNPARGSMFNGDPAVVVRHRYSDGRAGTEVLLGTPNGWRPAWFPGDLPPAAEAPLPSTVGETHMSLLAAGRHGDRLVTWSYVGFSPWSERTLPGPDGAVPLGVAAEPFSREASRVMITAVVVGRAGDRGLIWRSADTAATWDVREVPGVRAVTDVTWDGTVFVALAEPDRDGAGPVVLTSAGGARWTVDERVAPAAGALTGVVALIRPDDDRGMVLGGPPAPPPMVFAVGSPGESGCASVFRRDATAWVAEPLGCHGSPSALLALPDGRIAAAGGDTLWLRS
jgi:hypothetical protein